MLKAVGINMRHIQKIASLSQTQHIKELAITELLARKIKRVIVEGTDYSQAIDIDIFDKIHVNMLVQRLSQILNINLGAFEGMTMYAFTPII